MSDILPVLAITLILILNLILTPRPLKQSAVATVPENVRSLAFFYKTYSIIPLMALPSLSAGKHLLYCTKFLIAYFSFYAFSSFSNELHSTLASFYPHLTGISHQMSFFSIETMDATSLL